MKDIMGTMMDLARRGHFVIEQTESGGVFGMFTSTDFIFHRADDATGDLLPYEETLMRGLFPRKRKETSLSDLRNKFYEHIGAIHEQMYRELVKRGYYTRSPQTTRNMWLFGGIGLLLLAGGAFWVGMMLTFISPFMWVPAFGIGLVGVAAMAASSAMPAKTPKGAQEAARWNAFRRYLSNIERYADLEQVTDQFDKYIG